MKYNVEKMIAELCPTGVLYCEMGKLAQIGTGKSNGNEAEDNGEYPFFIRSPIVKRKNCYEYDEEAIIIPGEGGVGDIFHYINGKYALHQRVYRIHFTTKDVDTRFMYYYLSANFKVFIQRKAVNATVTSIRKPMIEQFPIPLPPLPIQQEIVRILDTFTNLTAELTAELTARRKQYEYYRDELLRFKNRKDIQWVPFGDYFEFKNGLNKGKEYFGSGNYIVNFTDVYKNRWLEKSMLKGRVQVEDKEVVAYSAQKGDVFFTRTSETREEIGMVSALVDDIDGCVFSGFVLRARPLSQNWLPKFCAYFFSTSFVRKEIIRYASFTTRALTSGPRLSKIKLPLLPIQEQEKIVDILDNFSSLCNGVEKGLPAEISARQKQYEYYRNQLLTFKQIGG